MDILIKSFNRPYCLQRCIKSIYRNVKGSFRIIVLDDGTPEMFLDKIVSIFPEVLLKKSISYTSKTQAIYKHLRGKEKFSLFSIPVTLWREEVASSSEIFLMMEDDNWFIEEINLDEILFEMRKNKFVMLSIAWQGNEKFIQGKKQYISENTEEIIPSISILSRILFLNRYNAKSIIRVLDKLKITSIFYRFSLLKNELDSRWPLYTLYRITSTFFNKHYWDYLWNGASEKVDELIQLKRAVEWFEKKSVRYAKTNRELTKTSYCSSATTIFDDIDFDIFHFNQHINNAWLKGDFDAMNNFPLDYDSGYVKTILDKAADNNATYSNWIIWSSRFKTQYRNIGCEVD